VGASSNARSGFRVTGLHYLPVASAPGPFIFKLLEGLVRDVTWGWNFGGTDLIGRGQGTELPSQRPSTLKK
jgi:hypothetical protein